MDSNSKFQTELKAVLLSESPQELFEFMEENTILFFSTPDISTYYRSIKHVDVTKSQKLMPKLIFAWMAFLSGDHTNLFLLMDNIFENELSTPQEISMFYSLKALIKYMTEPKEGLRYAKLSLDILPEDEEDFYLANAKLTYGQLLSSSEQYRLAAEMFARSYQIFQSLQLPFLGVIAVVNEALNRYKLGELDYVLNKCNAALLMSGRFKQESQGYWNIVNLPLGMCYYELNKPNLAIEHLKLAKASIDKFELFHTHGLVELYLFKSYYVIQDRPAMENLKNEAIEKFEHMHYWQTDLIISMFKILCHQNENQQIQSDIEKFELEYFKNGANSHSIVMETLVFLKFKDLSDCVNIAQLEKRLAKLKYIGFIPQVQLTLLQLAEMYYLENRQKEAMESMGEAIQIYKEFGISVCFYTLPLKSIVLIKKLNKKLYNLVNKKAPTNDRLQMDKMLTVREKEIMELIALGKTNEEMSKILFISVGTIKWHINHIFGKLEVKNRVQAIAKAKTLGEI